MVKVNTKIGNALFQVMNSRLFNPADFKCASVIIWYLRTVKENEAADWIEQNPSEYQRSIVSGIEIDSSLDADFQRITKDLKNKDIFINKG